MELNLQPQATTCFVSGQPFADGDRVASYLVRGATMEVVRYDVAATSMADFQPDGVVACRWVHLFKARAKDENSDRTLKLTAENLFMTLVDPMTEQTAETIRLVQFLALMLERKKILRPKGRSADREKNVFEHARTKQLIEVPVGELDATFFIAIQEQLSVLVGAPKAKAERPAPVAQA